MKYGMAQLRVPAIVNPQTDTTAATPSATTFGHHMQTHDIVTGISQMPQGTSRPGSSQIRLGSEKMHSYKHIASLLPDAARNTSRNKNSELAEPVTIYTRILRPKLFPYRKRIRT